MRNVAWLGGDLLALVDDESAGWRRVAARGLLGLDDSAVDALGEVAGEDAALYRACLAWMNRDETTATRLLQALPALKEARALLELIQRPRIDVLGFLPDSGNDPNALIDGPLYDPKFRLRNVGYERGASQVRPNADIHQLTGSRQPAFVVVEMIEWHMLPGNLRDAGCPVIGHTNDFDFSIQSVLPWLKQFDVILTIESIEPSGLAPLVGDRRIVTYPAIWSVGAPSCPTEDDRFIDFLMTNTVIHDANRDKEALLRTIVSVPNLEYVFCNGELPKKKFDVLMGASKLTLDFVRRPAVLSTRALQALAAGCCCLVPADSLNYLFVPPDHGLVITNLNDSDDIVRRVREVTQIEPDRYRAAAARGAEWVWRNFARARIGSRYLRFATIMAAFAEVGLRQTDEAPRLPFGKRADMWRGPSIPDRGNPETMDKLRDTYRRDIDATDMPAYRRSNEHGRALMCDYGLFAHRMRGFPPAELVSDALSQFKDAFQDKPDALTPTFNFMRCAFHFGTEADKIEAEQLAQRMIETNPDDWIVELDDDLLPYDFFPAFCNTRRLVNLMVLDAARPGTQRHPIIETILASVHFYLAWRTERSSLLSEAVRLDPSFVNAQLELSRALVADGDGQSAAEILTVLASTYLLSSEISSLVDRASSLAGIPAVPTAMTPFADRLVDMAVDYYADFSAITRATRRRFAETDSLVWRRSTEPVSISLIILDQHRCLQARMAALDAIESESPGQCELIYVDLYARLDEEDLAWTDVLIRNLDPMPIIDHRGRIFMKAFHEARGSLLYFGESLSEGLAEACLAGQAEIDLWEHRTIFIQLDSDRARATAIVLHRQDFVELGGFDLSAAAQGSRGGVHELAWRAQNAGLRVMRLISDDGHYIDQAEKLSLMPHHLGNISRVLDLTVNDNWSDFERTLPIWPDPRLKREGI
jgi:hypothetical protein